MDQQEALKCVNTINFVIVARIAMCFINRQLYFWYSCYCCKFTYVNSQYNYTMQFIIQIKNLLNKKALLPAALATIITLPLHHLYYLPE